MKRILFIKDGKFVFYFEFWRISRNKGGGNVDEWFFLSLKLESLKIIEN